MFAFVHFEADASQAALLLVRITLRLRDYYQLQRKEGYSFGLN